MNPIFFGISGIMFLVAVTGCFVNGAIVYVYFSNRQLQTVNNTFLVSMCINGLIISLFGPVLLAITCIKGEWIFGQPVCHFYSFIVFFLGLAIIATLTVMAIEKLIVIKFESRNMVTKRVCFYMLLGCHVYGLVISLMPFMGWNRYQLEGYNISCSLKMDGKDDNSTSFNVFMLIAGFVLPLGIMVTVFSKIILTMRGKRKASSFQWYSSQRKKILKREMTVTRTIIFMIGAFALAWTPFAVHCVASMLRLTTGMSPFIATIPSLIAKSSVIYHPLIYTYKDRQLRTVILRTFLCKGVGIADKSGTHSTVVVKGLKVPDHPDEKTTNTLATDIVELSQLVHTSSSAI